MTGICAGCLQKLPKREFLKCSLCKSSYDLDCANVPIVRFNNTMTGEHKQKWKCQTCLCAMPKTDNTTTPVRNIYNTNTVTHSPDGANHNNITLRRKHTSSNYETSPAFSDNESILGNTQINTENAAKCKIDTLILNQLDELLERKLEKNKKSLLSELKAIIIEEIANRVTDEISSSMNAISSEQQCLKKEIDLLNTHIKKLQSENLKLQVDIENLQKAITPETIKQDELINNFENSRKFVLYGLIENQWENENELFDRVTYIFQDLLNINLEEYIEDIIRIGRNGFRRPVIIELLSKKMVRTILQNKLCLRGTGLAIAEYLNENSRQTRKKLSNIMKDARRNGHHAVLRNNKLIINGTEYKFPDEPNTQTSKRELISNTLTEEQMMSERAHEKHNNRSSQTINITNETFRAY